MGKFLWSMFVVVAYAAAGVVTVTLALFLFGAIFMELKGITGGGELEQLLFISIFILLPFFGVLGLVIGAKKGIRLIKPPEEKE